jgi:hypothetical protein
MFVCLLWLNFLSAGVASAAFDLIFNVNQYANGFAAICSASLNSDKCLICVLLVRSFSSAAVEPSMKVRESQTPDH